VICDEQTNIIEEIKKKEIQKEQKKKMSVL